MSISFESFYTKVKVMEMLTFLVVAHVEIYEKTKVMQIIWPEMSNFYRLHMVLQRLMGASLPSS